MNDNRACLIIIFHIKKSYLYKISRINLLQCDLEIEHNVVSSRNVSVLLLSVSPKHKAKVPKETATNIHRRAYGTAQYTPLYIYL